MVMDFTTLVFSRTQPYGRLTASLYDPTKSQKEKYYCICHFKPNDFKCFCLIPFTSSTISFKVAGFEDLPVGFSK